MTGSSLRHAIRRRCPEQRDTLVEAVAETHGTETDHIAPVLDALEREGEVYLVDGVVKSTRGGV